MVKDTDTSDVATTSTEVRLDLHQGRARFSRDRRDGALWRLEGDLRSRAFRAPRIEDKYRNSQSHCRRNGVRVQHFRTERRELRRFVEGDLAN
jgi:hypothetical protein